MAGIRKIVEITNLACALPTGLIDTRANVKFQREYQELEEMVHAGDVVGAILEAADCLYYLVKAYHNYSMSDAEIAVRVDEVVALSGIPQWLIEEAAVSKYSLRARPGNPKSDAEERAAVEKMLRDNG